MSNKNEVFEYLVDQLRQHVNKKDVTSFNVSVRISDLDEVKQVNNNQCEDLAHEVLSLKNQLRDASKQIKELHKALVKATGDAEAYKLVRKQGQSGCREEEAHECRHNRRFVNGKAPAVCINCGVTKSSECEHEWQFYGVGFPCMCKKCGLKK